MKITHDVLESQFVRLEPLADRHRESLRAACAADPQLWRELYIVSMLGEDFDRQWTRLETEREAGRTAPYAVLVDGLCRGLTTLMEIDRAHRTVEIGFTYYEPSARGGVVNPAAKQLLLAHAFEAGAHRVQFRVDAQNARSRAAVLKLGATQEGILRHDKITWTGRVRSTVVFSILAEEWPPVRKRLDERIAAFAREPA